MGCLVCGDYTGIHADLSAGTEKKTPEYTGILITRTQKAEDLVRKAYNEGYIELKDASHLLGDIIIKAKEKMTRAQKGMLSLL